MLKHLTAACVALAMLSSVQSVWAGTIGVSNLGVGGFDGGADLGRTPSGAGGDDVYAAASFTTGTGSGWTLDAIQVLLNVDTTLGALPSDFATFTLVPAGADGKPDDLSQSPPALQYWNIDISGGTGTFTLGAPTLPVTLAASTTYWLVGYYDQPNYVYWKTTTDTDQSGLAGWSIGDQAWAQRDPGGAWNAVNPAARFQVNVTPVSSVPDAGSTIALLGLGLVGLTAARRRL